LDEFSPLAEQPDNLQERYQASFVISAGNYDTQYWTQTGEEARNASWKDTTEQGIRDMLQHLDNCKNASPKQ
jgi:hypothetical protein